MIPQPIYILFGAGFTIATCFALGSLMIRGLRLAFPREEERFFSFLTGAACLSLIVFLLAAAGLVQKGVFLALGIAAIALSRKLARPAPDSTQPQAAMFWRILFYCVFGSFSVIYFVNAMAPEVSPDGSAYHLGLAARYMREHGFHRITTNMYANLSQGLEMLFLFAYAFGRHSAAALVHLAFLVALAFGMVSYGRRFGIAEAGIVGAILVYACPVVGFVSASAYVDAAAACAAFAVFYLLRIWAEDRRLALLVPAGLLAGFCYAIKYTTGIALLYAVVFVVWTLRRQPRALLLAVPVLTASAALLVAPWMAKNWLWLGNPFSPFLNSFFQNPYIRVSFEKEYAEMMHHYNGVRSLWSVPLEVTVRGEKLQGVLGPLFLLAPLVLLALRRKEGRPLLAAGAVFLLTYPANIGTRFLIPALPFVAIAMGLLLVGARRFATLNCIFKSDADAPARTWTIRIPKSPGLVLVLVQVALSLPWLVDLYCQPYAMRLTRFPLRAALRLEPEETFLIREHGGYLAARMLETEAPKGSRTFAYDGPPEAYTTRDVIVGYQSAFGNDAMDLINSAADSPSADARRAAVRQMRSRGIDYLLENERDPHATDFRGRAAEWGITLVAERWKSSLYRLEP
jgi:hypothetical protein